MSLDIRIDPPSNGKQTVAIGGRLDTHTFGQLDQALAPLLADAQLASLVLDLSALEYISSAGIRSLFKARKALAARGGRVLVTNVQPQIQKVFDVVKAVPMNQVFASVAEADAYLDAMQRRVLQGEDAEDEFR
jgi:anti-anti-sigma factor